MKVTPDAVSGIARTILSQRYEDPKPTPDFHEELWELCCSDHKYVAIACPRGHAKTTAVTGAYVISTLVLRERKYVLIISDTEDQAAEFINELKTEFKENEDLIHMFEVDKIIKDASTDVIIRFKDGHVCRVIGRGAEQKVRGRKWRGTRPDLIVIDDLENEELTDSDTRRAKLKRWFYGSVTPALSDSGIIRYVGTILHFDSLLENLMPKPKNPDYKITPLRDSGTSGIWRSYRYRSHPSENDFSEILWESKFPEQKLRDLRDDSHDKGIPEVYAQEYLNQPISEANAYFRKQDFLEIDGADHDKRIEYVGSGDLAISERDGSAFTVLFAAGLDTNNYLQVRDRRKGRWDSDRIIEEIFSLVKRYGIREFFLESENIAKAIGPQIYRRMRESGIYFDLIPVTPSKDKQKRASPLQAMMKAGSVKFDKDAEWYPDLEREMLRFPKGPYKDDTDSLALLAQGVETLREPATDEELEEEEYQIELGNYLEGRDAVTGY